MTATEKLNKIALKYEAEHPGKFYAIDLSGPKFKVVCNGNSYQSCRKKAVKLVPSERFTIRKELPSVIMF